MQEQILYLVYLVIRRPRSDCPILVRKNKLHEEIDDGIEMKNTNTARFVCDKQGIHASWTFRSFKAVKIWYFNNVFLYRL